MLIEAPELSFFPHIRHAFFTREGGESGGIYASLNGGLGSSDHPGRVKRNRQRMADRLGVTKAHLLSLHQIHSAVAARVETPWPNEDRPRADAMVTAEPGIALAIATADCGPVLFADRHAGIVGAAHAGWRGALGGVLDATVDLMEELGATRSDIVAVLGPTIGRDAYEVGPEFRERFLDDDGMNARHFRPGRREGHTLFDLPAYIGQRLEATGIGEFASTDLCTYSDENRFFSYRRATHRGEPDYGRLISAIMLAN
ncbi:peptidoglycan editing factor PgeF [uncultured Enterovirga sp.]|uniref:peptidoglycan editing factor PgeF n=1 Tax=uncultured Enterovirga sp. TaxID=2026352 RepID=UPI0035CA4D34